MEVNNVKENWTYDHGGITRGDNTKKEMALIFTGGSYGEGADHILNVLQKFDIKAGFFVTGDYIRTEKYHPALHRMTREGHYLGPHSDSHPLYCPWEDREKTLVTEEFFKADLLKNIEDLKQFGTMTEGQHVYFIPPYEWFNNDQTKWTEDIGFTMFNFTPGSGSNRDWAPESHKSFAPSITIMEDILKYEQKDPHGLNGFLLLLHLGSERKDKTFLYLEPLLIELKNRGYNFVRVDELIKSD
jgi:peptidoglycan/xylan/chitin deacetylase (PgdA/CDA1 family)